MQNTVCDGIVDIRGKKLKIKGLNTQDDCDHSYCIIRRQKKENGCVDIPPKGLPWASGKLKYLPGQRNLYTDLYIKQQIEIEAAKLVKKNCPSKKNNKKKSEQDNQDSQNMNGGGGGAKTFTCCCCPADNGSSSVKNKKKKKKGKKGKKSNGCMTCCCIPDDNNGESEDAEPSTNQNQCCIEFEEVMICDGSSELRKGFLLRPSQRPDVQEAAEIASEEMANTANGDDKGMICLCIPRSYLKKRKRNSGEEEEEDICAKFKIKECPDEEGTPEEEGS